MIELTNKQRDSTSFTSILLFTPLEFFTLVLANGLSSEFKWQQVSSSLQDSSLYSGRSQEYFSLDGLHSSSNFQDLRPIYLLYRMHESRLVYSSPSIFF